MTSRPRRAFLIGGLVFLAIAAVLALALTQALNRRGAYVHVRWAPSVDVQTRERVELAHGLGRPKERPSRTWEYYVTNLSRANLENLIRDPAVEDTNFIDRESFEIEAKASREFATTREARAARILALNFRLTLFAGLAAVGLALAWSGVVLLARAIIMGLSRIGGMLAVKAPVFIRSIVFSLQRFPGGPEGPPLRSNTRQTGKLLIYLALSLWFCAPLFGEPLAAGHEDWDQHLFFYGQVLKNVIEYGQAPFWSPWYCGGNTMWQNPQVALLSPVFPLSTVMALPLAMKVNIVLHYWLGFIGVHLLVSRALKVSSFVIAMLVAIMFVATGSLAMHLGVGHSVFLPILYLPWTLFWLIKALRFRQLRDVVLAGGTIALMVWNGGVHVLPLALLPIAVLVIVAAAMTRDWRPLVLGACFAAFGVAFSAPKLVPAVLFVTSDRLVDQRDNPHPDASGWDIVSRVYLDTAVEGRLPGQLWTWHEYGNYIGIFAVLLLSVSLAWALWPSHDEERWLGVGLSGSAIFCFLLSLGEFAAWAPASWLHFLPLLSNYRIPARFSLVFIPLAACTVAWNASRLRLEVSRHRKVWMAIVAIGSIASVDMMATNRGYFAQAFHERPFEVSFRWGRRPSVFATDETTSAAPGHGSPMLRALVSDRLFIKCFEPLQLPRTVRPEMPPLFVEGSAVLQITRFSPNRIDFRVSNGDAPSRVYLNTNWGAGWQTNVGALGESEDALFATIPPKQYGRFSFWFVPPGLWAGTVVMILSVAAAIKAWPLVL